MTRCWFWICLQDTRYRQSCAELCLFLHAFFYPGQTSLKSKLNITKQAHRTVANWGISVLIPWWFGPHYLWPSPYALLWPWWPWQWRTKFLYLLSRDREVTWCWTGTECHWSCTHLMISWPSMTIYINLILYIVLALKPPQQFSASHVLPKSCRP